MIVLDLLVALLDAASGGKNNNLVSGLDMVRKVPKEVLRNEVARGTGVENRLPSVENESVYAR